MAVEDRLVALYKELTRDLAILLGTAQRGASEGFVQAQLAALGRQLRQLDAASAEWVRENVPAMYRQGARAAQRTIERAGLPTPVASFTGLDRGAVRALARRVSEDLGAVRTGIGRGLVVGDPRLGARAVEDALRGDNRFIDWSRGEARVRVPSGRLWRPDAYSRMLGRTAVADVRRVSFRQRYLQNGVDRVRVPSTGTTHDICVVWEEEALSLTGATPGLPTVDDAMAAGLFHPNCTHRYVVDSEAEQVALTDEQRASEPEVPLPILGAGVAGSRRPAESRRTAAAR